MDPHTFGRSGHWEPGRIRHLDFRDELEHSILTGDYMLVPRPMLLGSRAGHLIKCVRLNMAVIVIGFAEPTTRRKLLQSRSS